jgi:hypothetical protein
MLGVVEAETATTGYDLQHESFARCPFSKRSSFVHTFEPSAATSSSTTAIKVE